MTSKKPDTSTTGKHIAALDGLRGIAILMVMALHLLGVNDKPEGNFLVRFVAVNLKDAGLGVDLFFALSGFLITGILYDTLGSSRFFVNFYARRSLRVFPLYYGFTALLVAISYLRGEHWHAGILGILTYRIIGSKWPLTDSAWVNLNHFWSLAVEEQFYLFWPIAVFFLRRKRWIATAAVCGALISFGIRCYIQISGLHAKDVYLGYSWPPARFDELLFGGVLAILVRTQFRDRVLAYAPWAFWAGAITLFSYGATHDGLNGVGDSWVQSVGLFIAGLTGCAAIAACLRTGSLAQRSMQNAVLRFFGRYSYGLYVIHYTIIMALSTTLRPWMTAASHSKMIGVMGTAAVALGLSIVAAMLSFHLFEQPILALKRHFQDDSPRPKLRRELAS